jgi:hypothetical protein
VIEREGKGDEDEHEEDIELQKTTNWILIFVSLVS